MKTNMISRKNVSMFLTTAGLLLSLASTTLLSSAAFANGRGYGGADYSMVSVPVELDHALLVDDVVTAERICQNKYTKPVFEQMCQKLNGEVLNEFCKLSSIESEDSKIKLSMIIAKPDDERPSWVSIRVYAQNGPNFISTNLSSIKMNQNDVISSGSYDDFGIYHPAKNKIKKITIKKVQNSYFVNSSTEKQTNFLLQSERISECYETEIQKLLSK